MANSPLFERSPVRRLSAVFAHSVERQQKLHDAEFKSHFEATRDITEAMNREEKKVKKFEQEVIPMSDEEYDAMQEKSEEKENRRLMDYWSNEMRLAAQRGDKKSYQLYERSLQDLEKKSGEQRAERQKRREERAREQEADLTEEDKSMIEEALTWENTPDRTRRVLEGVQAAGRVRSSQRARLVEWFRSSQAYKAAQHAAEALRNQSPFRRRTQTSPVHPEKKLEEEFDIWANEDDQDHLLFEDEVVGLSLQQGHPEVTRSRVREFLSRNPLRGLIDRATSIHLRRPGNVPLAAAGVVVMTAVTALTINEVIRSVDSPLPDRDIDRKKDEDEEDGEEEPSGGPRPFRPREINPGAGVHREPRVAAAGLGNPASILGGTAKTVAKAFAPWADVELSPEEATGANIGLGLLYQDVGRVGETLINEARAKPGVAAPKESYVHQSLAEYVDQVAKGYDLGPGRKTPRKTLNGSVLNTVAPFMPLGGQDFFLEKSAPIYPLKQMNNVEFEYRQGMAQQSVLVGGPLSERPNDERARKTLSTIPTDRNIETADPFHPNIYYEPAVDPKRVLRAHAKNLLQDEANQPWTFSWNGANLRTNPRDAEVLVPLTYDTRDNPGVPSNVDTFTIGENLPRPYVATQPRMGPQLYDAPNVVGVGWDERNPPPDPRTTTMSTSSTVSTSGSPIVAEGGSIQQNREDIRPGAGHAREVPVASQGLEQNAQLNVRNNKQVDKTFSAVRRPRDEFNAANQLNPGIFAKKSKINVPGENVPPNIGRNPTL